MREYTPAEEAEKIANTQVIPKWHPDLQGASICYLLDTQVMKYRGRPLLAKIGKANAILNHLTGYDLVLQISGPSWDVATDKQKLALLDHELCHVHATEKDTGEIEYTLVGHDLEEFNNVVRRHGAWMADIDLFNEAQGELFAPAKTSD